MYGAYFINLSLMFLNRAFNFLSIVCISFRNFINNVRKKILFYISYFTKEGNDISRRINFSSHWDFPKSQRFV